MIAAPEEKPGLSPNKPRTKPEQNLSLSLSRFNGQDPFCTDINADLERPNCKNQRGKQIAEFAVAVILSACSFKIGGSRWQFFVG
jgi:hypothetical protein